MALTPAEKLSALMNSFAEKLERQAEEIKALRRQPEKRFQQVSAVAAVTARMLAIFDVPTAVSAEWKRLVMDGEDPEALERTTAQILSQLTEVRERMDRRIAELEAGDEA